MSGRFDDGTIDRANGARAGIGNVVDITTSGTGVVQASGPAESRPLLGFTFDKLDGYRGETPREYGVFVGTKVRFEEKDGHINRIWLDQPKR
jgi:hypothetical protein